MTFKTGTKNEHSENKNYNFTKINGRIDEDNICNNPFVCIEDNNLDDESILWKDIVRDQRRIKLRIIVMSHMVFYLVINM